MLQKEDAVSLSRKYKDLITSYSEALRRKGNRSSDMYYVFPSLYFALDCLETKKEATYTGFMFSTSDLPKKVYGNAKDPLQTIQAFVAYYSEQEFAKKLLDDGSKSDTTVLENLKRFYSELSYLCNPPKPIELKKSICNDKLVLKFPNRIIHDNFVEMLGNSIGKTPYFNIPTALYINGQVENGRLVATFPTKTLREEAISLLGLTEKIITRQGENQMIIRDPIIVHQPGRGITIDMPEHLYRQVKKQAYIDYRIIAKGLSAYAKSSNSFFSNFPAEINAKIASHLADVLHVELENDAAGRVASPYLSA